MWPDFSEFNKAPVSTELPDRFRFAAFRVCDGTYRDQLFPASFANAQTMTASGRLRGYIAYAVFPPSTSSASRQETFVTITTSIGFKHRPHMALMLDVESWRGKITGSRAREINELRAALIGWLNGLRPAGQRRPILRRWYRRQDRRRVVIYGNAGDLNTIYPRRLRWGKPWVVLANYSSNPPYPRKLAHQFTDHYRIGAPWGFVDMNAADGLTVDQVARRLGLARLEVRP